jgi:hypothetical protein
MQSVEKRTERGGSSGKKVSFFFPAGICTTLDQIPTALAIPSQESEHEKETK